MRGLAAVAIVGAALAACTLTTDLSGFASGSKDGGAPTASNGTSSGGTSGGQPGDAGTRGEAGPSNEAGAACNLPTDADSHNCGACGHDCLGGTCAGGKCAAATLIKNVFQRPLGIGVSRGKLYVGDQNTLVESDLDGENIKVVVTDVDVQYLWGTDDAVYFVDGHNDKVRRWAHTDDGSTTFATDATAALSGVAVSGADLYYTRYTDEMSGGGVYRMPLAGGAATKLKAWLRAETVTVADGKVYFAGDGEDRAVVLHDDGTTDDLYSGGGPTGIAVRGDDAFITLQGGDKVIRVSLSTKEKETVASGLGGPSGIVATATAIYWAEVDSGNVGVLVR